MKLEKAKRFVNQYEYNTELVKESINSWWNNKLKKLIVIIVLLMISIGILFLITNKFTLLIIGLLCLLPIIFLSLKKRIAIKTELERIAVLYKGEPLIIKVIFDQNICMITSQGERRVELSSIQAFAETKNLIVLMVKGSMTIAFSKKGFIEGNSEDFLHHIKNILKKSI